MSAFEAVATEIVPGPNNSVLRATLRIGDTLLVVADESPMVRHTRSNLYLYVPNADEVFERAVKAGAAVVMPVTDMPWGDRSGTVLDDFGNSWHIAKHLENVSPEEVARRLAAAPARRTGSSVGDVIRAYFACVNEARWNDYVALFAEDIILDDQMAGHHEGLVRVREAIPLFQSLADLPNFRSELLQVFIDVDEEHAVALWHMRLNAPDGTPVDARGSNLFWVHEGKIRYLRTIHDTAPFQPLFPSPPGRVQR